MKIEKQELLKTALSGDALKLAQSLYSTYLLNSKESSMVVPLDRLFHLFGLSDTPNSLGRVIEILEELGEPILVQNFFFRGEKYSQIFLTFCDYEELYKDGIKSMLIIINEMYLEAIKNYMLHPFLEIKH